MRVLHRGSRLTLRNSYLGILLALRDLGLNVLNLGIERCQCSLLLTNLLLVDRYLAALTGGCFPLLRGGYACC